jgi:hypothetical protein
MAYQNNIPQGNQRLSDSQGDLLANFQAIKQLIDVNHATFGNANEGKHNFVSLPSQSGDPVTLASEMALYTKLVTGVPQMFLRNQTNGSVVNFTSATASPTNGSTTLPSGIIIKWGSGTTAAGGSQTVTFATAFPGGILTCYATIAVSAGSNVNAEANDRDVRIYGYNSTTLSVVTYVNNTARTRAAQPYTWFAIGY